MRSIMANFGCLILLMYIVYANIAESCDVYDVDQGTVIQTQNYPKDYPNSFSQCWELYTDSALDDTVYLRFLDFRTEFQYDIVKVYDGSSIGGMLLESLSGIIRDDYSIRSSGRNMTVTFTSDISYSYEGFQACVCVNSSAPCSCPSEPQPVSLSTIIAIAVSVPMLVVIVAPIIIRLIHQHSKPKSSQRRVHPANNLRPQGQQIQNRGGQQVGQFRQQTRPPGQGIAPPSNGQLSGQQIPPPRNLPSAGQPMWGTSPSGQYPPPAGRQITPSAGQLPQLTGHLLPPTSQPPPYPEHQQVNQPQPPPYTPHPLSSAGPGQPPVSTAPPQQQTSSNTAVPPSVPPPAPEGLYRNSEHTEPPPAPKVT